MACFIVAEKLGDDVLTAKCLRYVQKHRNLAELAMTSRNWITILERYPDLAKTIVETMSHPNATDCDVSIKNRMRKLPRFLVAGAIGCFISWTIYKAICSPLASTNPIKPIRIRVDSIVL